MAVWTRIRFLLESLDQTFLQKTKKKNKKIKINNNFNAFHNMYCVTRVIQY